MSPGCFNKHGEANWQHNRKGNIAALQQYSRDTCLTYRTLYKETSVWFSHCMKHCWCQCEGGHFSLDAYLFILSNVWNTDEDQRTWKHLHDAFAIMQCLSLFHRKRKSTITAPEHVNTQLYWLCCTPDIIPHWTSFNPLVASQEIYGVIPCYSYRFHHPVDSHEACHLCLHVHFLFFCAYSTKDND